MAEPAKTLRTIEVEPDEFSIIKPGELIDIVEMTPLTLQDRRIYNLLILNAWESIGEAKEHRIHKRDLRGSHHTSERVRDSLLRLMTAVAEIEIERDGETFTRRVQLLGMTEESSQSEGLLYYNFPAAVRAIIRSSTQYARLQKQIMFAFGSKYALALYEMVQKRVNLKFKTSEEFTVERFRGLLGVEPGKLSQFKSFNQRALQPALVELNGLAEFGCKVEPVYKGRKVTGIRLSWWAKTIDEKKAAFREVTFSKTGRRARLNGKVEEIVPAPRRLPARVELPVRGHSALREEQHKSLRSAFPGIDIDEMERQFVTWNDEKGVTPDNYAGALHNFIRKKIARENIIT